MLLRERVFQMIWRPEVMFILMLIAVYGILGELSNPGGILPGVIGVVALVLALYMTSVLPVNIAGFALIALAIGLFVAEAFTPTFGLFTGAGTIAFLIGAIMLFDDAAPAFRLSLTMILPATVVTTLFFVFVVGAGLRAQRLPVRAGAETMHGQPATALTEITAASGRVLVEGEDWEAFSEKTVHPGETVQVIENRGLTLKVKPLERKDPS
jgi:membrane-bound serine protease (ClpP class)